MGETTGPRFDSETIRFLRQLAQHNDRTWFQANKQRYLDSVQAPSLEFVRQVGPGLARLSRHLVADPRPVGGSVMRIYRDVRFSKDKSPYKTAIGIHFYHETRKAKEEHLPGYFLHISPGGSWVHAGVWQPEPKTLERIRRSIVTRSVEWSKMRSAVGEIEGESLQRPPRGFDAGHPLIAELKPKSFTAGRPLPDAVVTSTSFPAKFLAACAQLDPLNRFLAKSLDGEY